MGYTLMKKCSGFP